MFITKAIFGLIQKTMDYFKSIGKGTGQS